MAPSDEDLEDLTNELIAVIWPYLDANPDDRDGVVSVFNNVMDSWSP